MAAATPSFLQADNGIISTPELKYGASGGRPRSLQCVMNCPAAHGETASLTAPTIASPILHCQSSVRGLQTTMSQSRYIMRSRSGRRSGSIILKKLADELGAE